MPSKIELKDAIRAVNSGFIGEEAEIVKIDKDWFTSQMQECNVAVDQRTINRLWNQFCASVFIDNNRTHGKVAVFSLPELRIALKRSAHTHTDKAKVRA